MGLTKNVSTQQELKLRPFLQRSDALTLLSYVRTPGELGHIQGSCTNCMTCVLHTARNSNVEIIMCVINKERQQIISSKIDSVDQ